jgi:hypothetical protein
LSEILGKTQNEITLPQKNSRLWLFSLAFIVSIF